MMMMDASPAIYQTTDYRSGTSNSASEHYGSQAISSSGVFSMKQIQPAILIRTVNSIDQLNVSSDSAVIDVNTDYEMKSQAQFRPTQAFWKSLTVWQRMSELVAAGAFLITCALIAPGIGRNDR